MLTQYHHMFKKDLRPAPAADAGTDAMRARPGQQRESQMLPYAWGPELRNYLSLYALSPWVYTAVNRMATSAKSAALEVCARNDPTIKRDNHGLVNLLGPYGRPNDYQSVREFWANHHTYYELTGNCYWYWSRDGRGMGAPTGVYLLHPSQVRVIPGSNRTVEAYEYQVLGEIFKLPTEVVTHFKKPNPFNHYYGLPALESLMISAMGDIKAAQWNRAFFSDDVSIPAGIFVIPNTVSDKDRDRIADELAGKFGGTRRTAVVRAEPGQTVFHEAGLKRIEMDFESLREMTRKEVYEALDIPLGYLSETSTEAHARVAERQYLVTVFNRLQDVADKINPEIMQFWPAWNTLEARFEDVRREAADWDQQRFKYSVLEKVTTVNEMREELGHETVPDGDVPAKYWRTEDRRDNGSVSDEGQVRDMVGREE